MVIAPVAVYKAESVTASVLTKLSPGGLVTLIKTGVGWVLVAKDGIKSGYVEKEE